ncbi:hypothetical protein [Bradyrhizobium neotropicale]|uniref:hypothetical protein n=1 Tax=Bradyrhizobium neotropicale TaxID=1497615 RepID=UPI001AD79902|nr:hypothetical protein [Bradyrhizobium neotropicale]MBO4221919.1 hypothetical protein [Bradyrhizobium neotropicale]
MAALRKQSYRSSYSAGRNGYIVDYSEEVTEEQVRKMDEAVRKEFETGNWVTVEQES